MKSFRIIQYLFLILIVTSCVEPFSPDNIEYEDILVIDGLITNENRKHTIMLSKTFPIDTTLVKPEKQATVYVIDSNNKKYDFTEIEEGVYESTESFAAEPNKNYTLKIETQNGRKYTSSEESTTPDVLLENINYSSQKNSFEENVVSITVNSSSSSSEAKYYRFQYEETYKITPPFWSNFQLEIVSDVRPYEVRKVQRTTQNDICYKTEYSNTIIQTETTTLSENKIVNFPVHSIPISDFKLTNRYSILIKQYTQNINAYNYYQTLKKFSNNDNIFSQSQVGFLKGNIFSETDANEKTIGYFEVCSVSSKRLFFNREDVTDLVPDYVDECIFIAPLFFDPFSNDSPLINELKKGTYIFFDDNNLGQPQLEGPYLLVKKVCGDCTVLGSNIKPSFWVD